MLPPKGLVPLPSFALHCVLLLLPFYWCWHVSDPLLSQQKTNSGGGGGGGRQLFYCEFSESSWGMKIPEPEQGRVITMWLGLPLWLCQLIKLSSRYFCMKNHPVVPVKMNKFSFIQGITFCFWSPRAPFCLPKHPSTVQASVLAELAEGPVVFSPSQCLKHGSFGRAAAFQALQTLGPKRQVEPLVSFGLLGIARPGAAPCLGVSSEAASCSLVPRHHNCREGAATCSAWQGFLCKEHQCLVVSSEFF